MSKKCRVLDFVKNKKENKKKNQIYSTSLFLAGNIHIFYMLIMVCIIPVCAETCTNKECPYGFLEKGCPRCECAENPCKVRSELLQERVCGAAMCVAALMRAEYKYDRGKPLAFDEPKVLTIQNSRGSGISRS